MVLASRELLRRDQQVRRYHGVSRVGPRCTQPGINARPDFVSGGGRPGLRGVGRRYLRQVQQAFNVQTGIADINLLVRVHVPLQLHAVVLLRVDRATNLRSCLQFRNGQPSSIPHKVSGKPVLRCRR